MALKVYEVCVLILISFGIIVAQSNDLFEPHIVWESEEITVMAGSNLTLSCEGNAPLSWKLPEKLWYFSNEDYEYWEWTKVHITDTSPKNKNYKYGSKAILQNVTYPHTGFIICYESNRPFRQDKIYMYVKDKTHVFASSQNSVVIYSNESKEVIIPCRPTSPDISLALRDTNFTKFENKSILDRVTYSPYYGFTATMKISKKFIFVCKFIKENATSRYNYTIAPEPPLKINLEKISSNVTYTGEKLILHCKSERHIFSLEGIEWITPTGLRHGRDQLVIENVTANDEGHYTCKIHQQRLKRRSLVGASSIYVNVVDISGNFINLIEENGVYELDVNVNKTFVQWNVNVDAFPKPKLTWFNNFNQEISQNSDKYEYSIQNSTNKTVLRILKISIFDSGTYTLRADNTHETRSLVLLLNVTDKPSVYIDFSEVGGSKFECKIFANPQPTVISWDIAPCVNDTCGYNKLKEMHLDKKGMQFISYATTDYPYGRIRCSVKNSIGRVESVRSFYIKNVTKGLSISSFDSAIDFAEETKEVKVVTGEKYILSCDSDDFNLTENYQDCEGMRWIHNTTKLQKSVGTTGIYFGTDITFSCYNLLSIEQSSSNTSGDYSCQYKNLSKELKNLKLRVLEPIPPTITKTNLVNDIEVTSQKRLELNCEFSGFPTPLILWYKDKKLLNASERINMLNRNQTINFTNTETDDEGHYRCIVSNKFGTVSKAIHITFLDNPKRLDSRILSVIVILMTLIILAIIFISFKLSYKYKLRRQIENFALANFEMDGLNCINPTLLIGEQIESLPYHYKWEFPIQEVKLGEQIGSGGFGVVVKAEARRIIDGEDFTTVAVKMVKKNARVRSITALVSELRIMAYLGNHLNIVNLLGACTKQLNKGELFLIVEYCCYGNLRNYLLNHRGKFVNQVDADMETINYKIRQNIVKETNSASENECNPEYDSVEHETTNEITIEDTNDSNEDDSNRIWINKNSHLLCTEDLLIWAFQVARGMDFLTSRHVLHGDLAARNILLTECNVVKICDFGLSRRVYTNRNYKKKSDSPLPFKWMALESIRDGIFSVESDVWSFGIVLWEFFSLGQTPYPGMQDEQLLRKLEFGYRMDRPKYAPKQIYQVMLECWRGKPFVRPSFRKLMDRISSLLEEDVKQFYFDMNRLRLHSDSKQTSTSTEQSSSKS